MPLAGHLTQLDSKNGIAATIVLTVPIRVINMVREAPAMTVRQNLGKLLNEVQYQHDSVLITKSGKPVAAMVNIELFKKIRLLEDEFERLANDLSNAYSGMSLEAASEEIKEALTASRSKATR